MVAVVMMVVALSVVFQWVMVMCGQDVGAMVGLSVVPRWVMVMGGWSLQGVQANGDTERGRISWLWFSHTRWYQRLKSRCRVRKC